MPIRINVPPVTRILLLVLAVQFCLNAAIRYQQWSTANDIVVPYLSLVPQLSLIYPWTFLTTTLAEQNIVALATAAATIFYGGRYLERSWSSQEFVKFLLVASLVPNAITFAILVVLFAVTGDMRWTLTPISGSTPLQASFLIAFAHLLPTHTVTLFKGVLSLRVPRFPLLHLILIFALSLTPFATCATVLLAVSAFLASYTYIRFYKPLLADLDTAQPSTLRGDSSDAFAFKEFFPDAAKPLVASVADTVYGALVSLGVCALNRHATQDQVAGMMGGQDPSNRQSGGSRAEAERRRALALKALDQRLHAAAAQKVPNSTMSKVTNMPGGEATKPRQAELGNSEGEEGMLGETSFNQDIDRDS